MIQVSSDQFHTLAHSLGLTRGKKIYRNYYAGRLEDPSCEPLVAKGLMSKGQVTSDGSGQIYHVTDAGLEFLAKFLEVIK